MPDAQDTLRVVRFLEYIGPRDWVEMCMETRAVKGTMARPVLAGGRVIREGVLGEFPETIEVPLLPCPACDAEGFRSPRDRDNHLLKCQLPDLPPDPSEMCLCGHERRSHIYHEGACRPGFVCQEGCERFRPASELVPTADLPGDWAAQPSLWGRCGTQVGDGFCTLHHGHGGDCVDESGVTT